MGKWLAWAGLSLLAYAVAGALPGSDVGQQVAQGGIMWCSGFAFLVVVIDGAVR